MKCLKVVVLGSVISAVSILPAFAHAALLSCYDNEDGTIDCEAGYSDGASAAGQELLVRRNDQRLLYEFTFDQTGLVTFDKPAEDFVVEFHGDAAHVVTVYGDDIVP
jgi:hypothetical protein